MLKVYVNVRKTFDSVHFKALRDLLCLHRIPARMTDLYSGIETAVKCRRNMSSFFHVVNMEVMQGCILAPSLFNTYMDWVLGTESKSL